LLLGSEGWARSLSLDLLDQLRGFEKNGQFRYTPPTHVMLAFAQALRELEAEGGVAARHARYRLNHATLIAGVYNYRPEDLETALSFLARSHARFPFETLVGRTFPLEAVNDAFAYAEQDRPPRVAVRP